MRPKPIGLPAALSGTAGAGAGSVVVTGPVGRDSVAVMPAPPHGSPPAIHGRPPAWLPAPPRGPRRPRLPHAVLFFRRASCPSAHGSLPAIHGRPLAWL